MITLNISEQQKKLIFDALLSLELDTHKSIKSCQIIIEANNTIGLVQDNDHWQSRIRSHEQTLAQIKTTLSDLSNARQKNG